MYPLAVSGRLAVVIERFLARGGTVTKMDLGGVTVSRTIQGKAGARSLIFPPLWVAIPGGGPGAPECENHLRTGGALSLLAFRVAFAFLISAFCLPLSALYSSSVTCAPSLQRVGLCPIIGRSQFPARKSLQKPGMRCSFSISLLVLRP